MKKLTTIWFLFALVLICLGTLMPLFHSGFFAFHDNTQVERVYEMATVLSDKIFPVRWVPDLGYGYGYPIFNFYAPLPYYIGGLLNLIGFSVLIATKLMFGVGIIISSISMFFLARKFFGNVPAVVASVVYSYFPYHAVNIYVRGAVDEFFAYAFLPLLFLGLFRLLELKKDKLVSQTNLITVLLISIGVFLVSLSHNLTIFMALLLMVPYFFTAIFIVTQKKTFLILFASSVLLGLLLASFYLIPAFLEMGYTNIVSQVGGGATFSDHFVCVPQFWNSLWGFGGSIAGCIDGLSFRLGKLNIILVALGLPFLLYTLIYKRKFERGELVTIVSFVLLIISLILTISVSNFIWSAVPFMKYIQYPWRFINFIGLFGSLIVGFLVFKSLELIGRRWQVVLALLIIFLTLLSNYKLFVPQAYNSFPSDYYTEKENLNFTVSKISDEYMPPGFLAPKSLGELPSSQVELLKATGNIGVLESRTNYLKTAYQIQNDGVAHANLAYFPGWRAYVNGVNQPIVPTANGMNVALSKGSGILEFKLYQTSIELVGNALTIIVILGIIIGIIKLTFVRK